MFSHTSQNIAHLLGQHYLMQLLWRGEGRIHLVKEDRVGVSGETLIGPPSISLIVVGFLDLGFFTVGQFAVKKIKNLT